jgi:hypothetical protein
MNDTTRLLEEIRQRDGDEAAVAAAQEAMILATAAIKRERGDAAALDALLATADAALRGRLVLPDNCVDATAAQLDKITTIIGAPKP